MIHKKKFKGIRIKFFTKIALVLIVSLTITNMITLSVASFIIEKTFVSLFTLSNDKILEQIANNFNDFNTQTISVMNTYRQSRALKRYFTNDNMNSQELFKVFYNIRTYLESVESSTYFPTFNIVTLGRNGKLFISAGEKLMMSKQELIEHPITIESIGNPRKLIYKYNDSGLTTRTQAKKSIIATSQLRDPYTAQTYGTLYITIDEKKFSEIYSVFASDKNHMMIIDKEGIVVSSNVKSLIGNKNERLHTVVNEITESKQSYKIYKDKKEKHVIIVKYLPMYEMYLVNEVNINTVLENFYNIRPKIFGICFLVINISIVLVFFLTRKITSPLTQLVRHMKNTKNGNLSRLKSIHGSYEVQEIQVVYNDMIDEINEYIETIVREQKQRRQAELEALQMQINPHFLYNTLATIKYLSWQENIQAVTTTINALIMLLKNTIHRTSETITIEEEIENLKNYVIINHIRYGEAINVEYNVEENCLKCKIPVLILQPFIENAFFHGYQQKKEGTIRIFVRHKNKQLLCEIIDDGDGIPEEKQKDILKQTLQKEHFSSIGINNVNERIKIIYGEAYGVKINSKEQIGTVIKIIIPYEEQ